MSTTAPPTLLVLAAGMGSRYGGLKQIEAVGPGGETIIDYSISTPCAPDSASWFSSSARILSSRSKRWWARVFEKRIAVEYVFQELDKIPAGFSVPAGRTKPWGTTQAIMMAADAIHEPFAVINADDFYGAESYQVMARQLQSGSGDYAMVGFVLRNTLSEFGTVARGVCRVESDGYLEQVVELTAIAREGDHARDTASDGKVTMLTGDEPVSMNMFGFTPQVFGRLDEHFRKFLEANGTDLKKECYVPNTVNDMLVAGQAKVKVLHSNDSWLASPTGKTTHMLSRASGA